ncbi:MAG: hypothetical protein ACJ75H_25295 [Thermoanaerobaculia bacterium]
MKKLKISGLILAAALSVAAVQAQTGFTKVGCWSPYPNCVGAKDVYKDANGNYWQCKACGTTTNPSTSTCYQSGNLNAIGYWCPRESS